jgi:hypothetical protein
MRSEKRYQSDIDVPERFKVEPMPGYTTPFNSLSDITDRNT